MAPRKPSANSLAIGRWAAPAPDEAAVASVRAGVVHEDGRARRRSRNNRLRRDCDPGREALLYLGWVARQ